MAMELGATTLEIQAANLNIRQGKTASDAGRINKRRYNDVKISDDRRFLLLPQT